MSGTECEVTFSLTNPATAQSSPAVIVLSKLSNSVGSIFQSVMTKPGSLLYGVANGTDPLLVTVPTFSVKTIQQSTPVPDATNTMTLTLTADVDLPTGSTVTIAGLTGSQKSKSPTKACFLTVESHGSVETEQ